MAGHFSGAVHGSGNETITGFCWVGFMQPIWEKTVIAVAKIRIRPFMGSDSTPANHPEKAEIRRKEGTKEQRKPKTDSSQTAA